MIRLSPFPIKPSVYLRAPNQGIQGASPTGTLRSAAQQNDPVDTDVDEAARKTNSFAQRLHHIIRSLIPWAIGAFFLSAASFMLWMGKNFKKS